MDCSGFGSEYDRIKDRSNIIEFHPSSRKVNYRNLIGDVRFGFRSINSELFNFIQPALAQTMQTAYLSFLSSQKKKKGPSRVPPRHDRSFTDFLSLSRAAMLSESFVASLSGVAPASVSSTLKDVGICIHELQPASTLRTTFKKSSTGPNGLAVSPTHVYAAQTDKAVVHVYSRIRGNQEATVPFPERIRSVAVAGGRGETLVLGTEGGRLILWEVRSTKVSSVPWLMNL